jgi:hypothetical protein
LAAAVPIDTDRDQHRLAGDHASLAHPLVARVEDQIRKGFGATGELRQIVIQPWFIALIEEAEKLWPHSSSVMAFTFRVETPCTYISASAANSARSERWKRSNSSVENRPVRSCGTRNSSLPTRVIALPIDAEQRQRLLEISRSRTEPTGRVERARIWGAAGIGRGFVDASGQRPGTVAPSPKGAVMNACSRL